MKRDKLLQKMLESKLTKLVGSIENTNIGMEHINSQISTVGSVRPVIVKFIASAGKIVYTAEDAFSGTLFYDIDKPAYLDIGNGVTQYEPTNFAKTSSTSFTLAEAAPDGELIVFHGWQISDGIQILTGSGVPDDSIGTNGYQYIDTFNGDLYKKIDGTWGAPIINLKSIGTLPGGGTTGQNLLKLSNADGDYGWGYSGASAIGSYTVTENDEIHVSAVDLDTNTFTSIGHGQVDGTKVSIVPNLDCGKIYFNNIIPGGLTHSDITLKYCLINTTEDTFQISLTLGGAAVDVTANANMDLSKWHFEIWHGSDITLSGLPAGLKRARVIIRGKALLTGQWSYIRPNGISSGGFCHSSIGGADNLYPTILDAAPMFIYSDTIIDTSNFWIWYINFFGVKPNTTTANSVMSYAGKMMIDPRYRNTEMTSIQIANPCFANGTVIEIYKA